MNGCSKYKTVLLRDCKWRTDRDITYNIPPGALSGRGWGGYWVGGGRAGTGDSRAGQRLYRRDKVGVGGTGQRVEGDGMGRGDRVGYWAGGIGWVWDGGTGTVGQGRGAPPAPIPRNEVGNNR